MYDVYKLLYDDVCIGKSNWVSNIRDLLYDLGLNFVWNSQDASTISIDIIKTRITNQYFQTWSTAVQECEKLCIYYRVKHVFEYEKYLNFCNDVQLLARLRSGTLKLNVETGRYSNISREQRLCNCCNMGVVEDVYHFILICPAYRSIRITKLPKYYCSWPNKYKLECLIKATNRCITFKLCKYLKEALKTMFLIIS